MCWHSSGRNLKRRWRDLKTQFPLHFDAAWVSDSHGFRLQVLLFIVRSIRMCLSPLYISMETLISSRTKWHTLRLIVHYLSCSLSLFFKGIDKNIFFLSLKKNDLIKCEYHYMTLTEKEQMIIYYSEDQHHECNIQKWTTLNLYVESSSCLLKAFKFQALIRLNFHMKRICHPVYHHFYEES